MKCSARGIFTVFIVALGFSASSAQAKQPTCPIKDNSGRVGAHLSCRLLKRPPHHHAAPAFDLVQLGAASTLVFDLKDELSLSFYTAEGYVYVSMAPEGDADAGKLVFSLSGQNSNPKESECYAEHSSYPADLWDIASYTALGLDCGLVGYDLICNDAC